MCETDWPRVILFGDSLTQRSFGADGGWGSVIADNLQRKCDVINRGFSGYNTRWCRMMLPQMFKSDNVKDIAAFTIFLGANDTNNAEKNPRQHVPLKEYKDNLIKMVEYLIEIGLSREKIILIGPPPCNPPAWKKFCEENGKVCSLDLAVTGEYAAACCEAAKQMNVSLVELYLKLQEHDDWQSMFCDGLHFASPGSKLVAQLVWPEIEARVKQLPEMMFPSWDQIDYEKPENTFSQ